MKQNYRWALTFFLIIGLSAVGLTGDTAKEKKSKSAAGVERSRPKKLSQADYTELEELMRKESRWLGKGELTPDERKRKIELCKNADEKLYKLNTKIRAEETIKKYRPEVEKNIEKLKENFDKKVLGNEEVYEFKELALARDKRAIPILTKILLEYDLKNEGEPNKLPSAEMRKMAANALGSIRDKSAILALKEALKDKDEEVVLSAIKSLGEIGGTEAIEILNKIEVNGDRKKGIAIANALIQAGNKEMGLLKLDELKTSGYLIQFIRWDIIKYKDCRSLLLYVAEDGETDRDKAEATCVLSEFGDKKDKEIAFKVAIKYLDSKDGRARSNALTCLENVNSKKAIPYIEKFLKIDFNDFTYLDTKAKRILEKLYEKK